MIRPAAKTTILGLSLAAVLLFLSSSAFYINQGRFSSPRGRLLLTFAMTQWHNRRYERALSLWWLSTTVSVKEVGQQEIRQWQELEAQVLGCPAAAQGLKPNPGLGRCQALIRPQP